MYPNSYAVDSEVGRIDQQECFFSLAQPDCVLIQSFEPAKSTTAPNSPTASGVSDSAEEQQDYPDEKVPHWAFLSVVLRTPRGFKSVSFCTVLVAGPC